MTTPLKKKIKIIALLHEEPEALPAKKVELEKEAQDRLNSFREKVGSGRLVKTWSSPNQLAGQVALSLTKTIKMYPAVGWVRDTQGNSTELLMQINELRDSNENLVSENRSLKEALIADDDSTYASGEKSFNVKGKRKSSFNAETISWHVITTWNQIISLIGPHLFQYLNDEAAMQQLTKSLLKVAGTDSDYLHFKDIDDEVFQTIKIQLLALGYIKLESLQTTASTMALFWIITEKGKRAVISLCSVKKDSP